MNLAYAPDAMRKPMAVRSAATLDIGVGKTSCLIGAPREDGEGRLDDPAMVLGLGVRPAVAPDPRHSDPFEECRRAIRVSVHQAERMAGVDAGPLTATYSGPGLRTLVVRARVRIRHDAVGPADVSAALVAAERLAGRDLGAVLHMAPRRFWIDDNPLPVRDPLGLQGRALLLEASAVGAPSEAIEALCTCVEEAGYEIDAIAPGAYAAGLAVLSREEREVGALVVDFGAGGTGLAVFRHGMLMFAETLPIGGVRVTRDIAKRLDAPFAAAERAKLVYGALGREGAKGRLIEPPRFSGSRGVEPAAALRAAVAAAIRPRFEQIMIAARDALVRAGFSGEDAVSRAVLTGGGALLPGACGGASEILGVTTRLGAPADLGGGREQIPGSAYAAGAGALRWRLDTMNREAPRAFAAPPLKSTASAMRMAAAQAWGWLKENF